MELRNHPLMFYKGTPNWLPTWVWIGGDGKVRRALGEVGVLLDVIFPKAEPYNRFYLIVLSEDDTYMGALLFDDVSFCRQIFRLLQGSIRQSIKQIGGVDLRDLL